MAPHDFELLRKTLVIFPFTFNTNLKTGTMLAEYMHNLERLRKQFLFLVF